MPKKRSGKLKAAPIPPVVHPDAAGIDIGATEIFVAVPVDRDQSPVRSFQTILDPISTLIDERSALLRQFSELGDFQPGSISSRIRKCGKASCHCAKPNDPGHGPYFQLTQKVEGKTVSQTLSSPAAVRKAEGEIAEYRKFQGLSDDLVDVNRKICLLRPVEQIEQTAKERKRRKRSNRKSRADPQPAA